MNQKVNVKNELFGYFQVCSNHDLTPRNSLEKILCLKFVQSCRKLMAYKLKVQKVVILGSKNSKDICTKKQTFDCFILFFWLINTIQQED